MDYIDLTEKLVNKCLGIGAEAAEVFIETGRNLSVQVLNGEIETIEEASSRGVGFRVFTKGGMGFSHCNDFSDSSIEDTISKAISFAKLSTPDENNILPDNKVVTDVGELFDPSIIQIALDKKIELALELEEIALNTPDISKSSGAGYEERESEIFIGNSNGILKNYKSSACSLGVSVVAEKGEQKNTGGEYCSRVFFSDLLPVKEIAAEATAKALELIDPVMINTQKAAVIFDRDIVRSLIQGVISALDGERVLQGASFLKDYLEKQFTSPLLTVTDDGTLSKNLGSKPFDGEGVPTRKTILIENGSIKNFIYNTKAAKRAGVISTGNATRRGFTSLPEIGTHKVFISKGNYSPEEIVASTHKGLLLKEVTGYGVDPVSGNFSGGASGLWISNGRIIHPVKGVTIAGSAMDILNSIDMIGNDTDVNRSFVAPTVRIAEMQIGGK